MSQKTKIKIETLQQYAISKNGQLLSTEYINNSTNLLWKCKNEHQWEAKWNNIKYRNSWCPVCAEKTVALQQISRRTDILELQQYAKTKNGKLISTEYINANFPVLWECEKEHQWETNWHTIKSQNTWCPYCADNKNAKQRQSNINELIEYAINKGGKLISTEYINSKLPLIWECNQLHQWKAAWSNIKHQNQWCPYCSFFKTETQCRTLLEQKLGFELIKTRFYYNDQRFEWDGYNEKHKIAFEYHGYQHYIFPNHFHKTKDEFLLSQVRDHYKEQYAKEHDITLLIIPYTVENIKEYVDTFVNRRLDGTYN
jgi:hypothetical protein